MRAIYLRAFDASPQKGKERKKIDKRKKEGMQPRRSTRDATMSNRSSLQRSSALTAVPEKREKEKKGKGKDSAITFVPAPSRTFPNEDPEKEKRNLEKEEKGGGQRVCEPHRLHHFSAVLERRKREGSEKEKKEKKD